MAYYYDLILDDYEPDPHYDTITIFHYKKHRMAIVEYEKWNNTHNYIKCALFAALLARIFNANIEFLKNDQNKIHQIYINKFKNGEFDYMIRKLQQKFGFGLASHLVDKNNKHTIAISTQIFEQQQFETICRALEVYKFPEDQKIVDNLNILD